MMSGIDNHRPAKLELYPYKLYNKVEGSSSLCNKKTLFCNLKEYYEAIGQDPYLALPITFHIKDGVDDTSFTAFREYYSQNLTKDANMWIIKPGENANRGNGIQVENNFKEIE